MVNKKNIHSIINARGLARNLIYVDSANEKASLQVPNLVLMKFDKYLKERLDAPEMSDEYIVKKSLEFVHSSRSSFSESACMESKFDYEFTQKSFYDSCKRILSESNEIGDCVGLSQVIKYLLDSKGIESKVVHFNGHISLEVKVDEEIVPLEATVLTGYGFVSGKKRLRDNDFASIVGCNAGVCLYNEATEFKSRGDSETASKKYFESLRTFSKSIDFDHQNISAYKNRSFTLMAIGMTENSISDFSKAIRLDPTSDTLYFARAFARDQLGRYKKSLLDYEKYASFSEANAKEVSSTISDLKEKIKNQ